MSAQEGRKRSRASEGDGVRRMGRRLHPAS